MFAGGPAFDGFEVTNFFYFWICFSCFESQRDQAQNGLPDRPCGNYAYPGGGISFFDRSWILDLLLSTDVQL